MKNKKIDRSNRMGECIYAQGRLGKALHAPN